MRRIMACICLILVTTMLSTGLALAEPYKITQISDLDGKVLAMMSTPQDPAMIQAYVEQKLGVKFGEMKFFDTFSAAVAALKSNQVDAVFNTVATVKFYAYSDESLDVIQLKSRSEFPGKTSGHMALRADDAELLDQINSALIAMRDDGTLDALSKEFVTELTADMQLEGKEMPRFDGAPTLSVGVGGDVPPIDYVAADGKPAGYNVELLALLGEKLRMNIEISVIPMESKFPSLAANKIDVFFFHIANADIEVMAQTLKNNNGAALTEPYYNFTGMGFLVMK